MTTTTTIPLGPDMTSWLKGNACGAKVHEAHADVEFEDHAQRVRLFWYCAGMLAAGEYELTELDPIFYQGVALHAPPHEVDEDEAAEARTA